MLPSYTIPRSSSAAVDSCSDGSESGPGAVVHHNQTLIDSSDDDAPFTVPTVTQVGVGPRVSGGHSTVNPGP